MMYTIEQIREAARDHLVQREGYRNTVYADSLGYATVGIGHLVTNKDNLQIGDIITDKHVEKLFQQDTEKSIKAAMMQASMAGQSDNLAFLIALTSVNFQLGTGWTKKFKITWPLIVNGQYDQAIENLYSSKWYKQTPTRVNDFVDALNALKMYHSNSDEEDGDSFWSRLWKKFKTKQMWKYND